MVRIFGSEKTKTILQNLRCVYISHMHAVHVTKTNQVWLRAILLQVTGAESWEDLAAKCEFRRGGMESYKGRSGADKRPSGRRDDDDGAEGGTTDVDSGCDSIEDYGAEYGL